MPTGSFLYFHLWSPFPLADISLVNLLHIQSHLLRGERRTQRSTPISRARDPGEQEQLRHECSRQRKSKSHQQGGCSETFQRTECLHTYSNGPDPELRAPKPSRMWGNRNAHSLQMGRQNDTDTLKDKLTFLPTLSTYFYHVCVLASKSYPTLCNPIDPTVARQAPLSIRFSRQEYWSGLPFPSPGDLPDPGIEPGSLTLRADSLPSEPPGKPHLLLHVSPNPLNLKHQE